MPRSPLAISPRRLLFLVLAALLVLPPVVAGSQDLTSEPVDGLQQAFNPTTNSSGTPTNEEVVYDGEPLTVQAVEIGRDSAEPTIAVLDNGDAFYAAGSFDAPGVGPSVGLARTEVFRSQDGGLSWESVQPTVPGTDLTLPPTTLDPYVYADTDTGRVFNPELYAGCTFLNFSDDSGETWTSNPLACGDFVNDHQTIWTGPPPANLAPLMVDYPNVLYYCFNRIIDSNCGRSLDGGLTFIPTATPAFLGFDPAAGGLCGGLHGHIKTDDEGRLFLPKGHCGNPWLAVSEDGGDTWTRAQVADISSSLTHTAVDIDDAGNVYYTWIDAANRLPYLAVSTDNGATFGEPMMIAPPGVSEVNFPVLTAGAEGRIAVQFPGTTATDRTDTQRPWNSYQMISTDILSENPLFISTTANPLDDPIHRGNCNGRCAGMFDFLDIKTSPVDGMFWSAITDTCTLACIEGGTARAAEGVAVRQLTGPVLRPTPEVEAPSVGLPELR